MASAGSESEPGGASVQPPKSSTRVAKLVHYTKGSGCGGDPVKVVYKELDTCAPNPDHVSSSHHIFECGGPYLKTTVYDDAICNATGGSGSTMFVSSGECAPDPAANATDGYF